MRKIIGEILVIIVFAILIIISYNGAKQGIFCNQFMQRYIKNPPTNVGDYTQQDVAFDEMCTPTDNTGEFFAGLLILGVGALLIRKKKKQIGRP